MVDLGSLLTFITDKFTLFWNKPRLKIIYDPNIDLRMWQLDVSGVSIVRKVATVHVANIGTDIAKRCEAFVTVRPFDKNIKLAQTEYPLHWADTDYKNLSASMEPVDIHSLKRRLDVAFAQNGQNIKGSFVASTQALAMAPIRSQFYLPSGKYKIQLRVVCQNGKGNTKTFVLLSPQSWKELNMIEQKVQGFSREVDQCHNIESKKLHNRITNKQIAFWSLITTALGLFSMWIIPIISNHMTTIINGGSQAIGHIKTGNGSPVNISNRIIERGYLDEIWDFEKIRNDKNYVMWMIGLKDGKISGVSIATDDTVTFTNDKFFNMMYKSKREYYANQGSQEFRNVINYYKNILLSEKRISTEPYSKDTSLSKKTPTDIDEQKDKPNFELLIFTATSLNTGSAIDAELNKIVDIALKYNMPDYAIKAASKTVHSTGNDEAFNKISEYYISNGNFPAASSIINKYALGSNQDIAKKRLLEKMRYSAEASK